MSLKQHDLMSDHDYAEGTVEIHPQTATPRRDRLSMDT